MAQGVAKELIGVADGTTPPLKKDGRVSLAGLRRSRASFNLADTVNHKTASGDTNILGSVPEGAAFAFGTITSDVSLGTSTVAIGTVGTPAKHRAAAVHTTVDQPVLFGKAAAVAEAPKDVAPEQLIMTIGAANLPATGTLAIDLYYSMR